LLVFPYEFAYKLERVIKNAVIRAKSTEISPLDERKLLQKEDLDPKLSSNLIDSIMNYDQKGIYVQPKEKNSRINDKIVRSLDAKKHENNKKLLNDVIANRLVLERRQKKVNSWSVTDFEMRERTVLKDSLNNFKTLSILMSKASTEHILNKEYLKDKIRNQLKKQEIKTVLIDKEELKRLKNLKEEIIENLRKNQQEFEEYQMEIMKRNKVIRQIRFDICNFRKQITSQFSNVI